MDKYEQVKAPRKQILINNFLGGISWALGATLGIAIIFILVGFIGKNVNLVPIVGDFVADVIKEVESNNPQLIK